MKHKKTLIALGVLIFVGVAWLLFQRNPALSGHQTTQEAFATASPAQRMTPYVGPLPDVIPQQPYKGLNDPRWPVFWAKREKDPDIEWKTPIEFYGKVVDQDGKPVEGGIADVIWTDMSAKGSSQMEVTSDADGLFSITGIRGKGMTVQVNKDGYYRQLTDTKSIFEYAGFWEPSYHVPDKSKPVLFRLRKKGEAAELLHYGPTLFGAKPDGSPVIFDLATGRKTSGNGDVSVRVAKGARNADKQFDWEVTLEGVGSGAGLVESKDEFMVEAPEESYQPNWKFVQKAGAEGYQSEMQAKFFVKTAGGQFARIEVRVLPEYSEMAAVDLASYFNPEPGNRNLEFDPEKAIKP
jgi:hypothetical protein